ncbi:MAG: hypothetical protein ACYC1I_02685 [Acidimicrobiales bacterium]
MISVTSTTTTPRTPFPFVDKTTLLVDLNNASEQEFGTNLNGDNPAWINAFVNAFTAEEERESVLVVESEPYYVSGPISEANAYAASGTVPQFEPYAHFLFNCKSAHDLDVLVAASGCRDRGKAPLVLEVRFGCHGERDNKMTGIYTVSDLIERLQLFPQPLKITIVNVTPGKDDQRLGVLGVGPLLNDPDTVMIAAIELPTE